VGAQWRRRVRAGRRGHGAATTPKRRRGSCRQVKNSRICVIAHLFLLVKGTKNKFLLLFSTIIER
jgi:hypothetical protein